MNKCLAISEDRMESKPRAGVSEGRCCCLCLSTSSLSSILHTHYHEGQPEVYAHIIQKCFCLQLVGDEGKYSYMICDVCVSRLREAFSFRTIVEIAQESIQREIENDNFVVEHCKAERLEEFSYNNMDITMEPSDSDNSNENYVGQYSLNVDVRRPTSPRLVIKKPKNKIVRRSRKRNVCNTKLKSKSFESNKNIKIEVDDALESSETKNGQCKKMPKYREQPYKLEKDDRTCKICNETFPLHNTLIRHMSVHFPNHICHICARFFTNTSNLQSHVARHKQNLELQTCEICHKKYRGIGNLRKHMRYHNGPDAIYKCPHCSERFASYYKRIKHLIDVHNDEAKKYKCKHCPKRYFQATTLSRHIKVVHLQERRYVCQECGNSFFAKSGLTEHMLKHTGVKDFRCEICNKSYGRRYTLREHMKIHNNIKNFVCPICSRAFTQKCTLKGHLKVHEKVQVKIQSNNDV